ncbi:unnamed protein product [Closterium sp. NIES-64]|nr:unnamed protein product [Closterium sp. NIES-64]
MEPARALPHLRLPSSGRPPASALVQPPLPHPRLPSCSRPCLTRACLCAAAPASPAPALVRPPPRLPSGRHGFVVAVTTVESVGTGIVRGRHGFVVAVTIVESVGTGIVRGRHGFVVAVTTVESEVGMGLWWRVSDSGEYGHGDSARCYGLHNLPLSYSHPSPLPLHPPPGFVVAVTTVERSVGTGIVSTPRAMGDVPCSSPSFPLPLYGGGDDSGEKCGHGIVWGDTGYVTFPVRYQCVVSRPRGRFSRECLIPDDMSFTPGDINSYQTEDGTFCIGTIKGDYLGLVSKGGAPI